MPPHLFIPLFSWAQVSQDHLGGFIRFYFTAVGTFPMCISFISRHSLEYPFDIFTLSIRKAITIWFTNFILNFSIFSNSQTNFFKFQEIP